jgi:hypothetical protein
MIVGGVRCVPAPAAMHRRRAPPAAARTRGGPRALVAAQAAPPRRGLNEAGDQSVEQLARQQACNPGSEI